MVVLYKRIFRFKTMEKYAKANYAIFGFPNPPGRRTIRRRFLELPKILAFAIPHLAIESLKYSYDTFHFRFAKDHTLLSTLLTHLQTYIGILVGDNGYFAITSIKSIYEKWSILVQTPSVFENFKNTTRNWFKKVYNDLVKTTQAGWLYKKRKPAIEPVFSIIKELFDLEGNDQLPYKSLKYNQAFLLITVILMQLLMIDNFVNKKELASTETFMAVFR
jgi:hypothetical protein